jgi:hypothetical protein
MIQRITICFALLLAATVALSWVFIPSAIPWIAQVWRSLGAPAIVARTGYLVGFCFFVLFLSLRLLKSGPV